MKDNLVFPGLFIVVAFLAAPFASAQTAAEIRAQIDAQTAEITQLNKEIAAFEKQLTELGSKKQTLQSTLSALDISRKQVGARIAVTKSNITTIELQLKELNRGISSAESSISAGQSGIGETIAHLNEADATSIVETFLRDESFSAIWAEAEEIQTIQDALGEQISELTAAKETLTDHRDASEKKRQELLKERQILAAQQQSLDVMRREQQALLNQTKSQESNYQKLVEEKKAAKIAFEQTLNELESKLVYELDPSRIPSANKGILRWPLDNVTITQYFGNTPFAKSGAYNGKSHNGLDFRASVGTPVKAALTGVVEGTGNTDAIRGCYSYGKWVLVKHGNGLTTLYAHLSQINVAQGQQVSTGSILGFSGFTGYATGPHLHFSVFASSAVQIMRLSSATGKKSPCANATLPVSPLQAYLNPLDYL